MIQIAQSESAYEYGVQIISAFVMQDTEKVKVSSKWFSFFYLFWNLLDDSFLRHHFGHQLFPSIEKLI